MGEFSFICYNQQMLKTNNLKMLLLFAGLFFLVFGFIHFTVYFTDGTKIKLFDAIFNSTMGFLDLASYYFLNVKNRKALYPVGISIFLILIYSPLVGRGIGQNLFSVIFTSWILYKLVKLDKSKYFE